MTLGTAVMDLVVAAAGWDRAADPGIGPGRSRLCPVDACPTKADDRSLRVGPGSGLCPSLAD